jgi:hypothetical protein
MSITLIRSVASAALLAALATGCGTAVAAHSAASKPTATQPSHPAPMHTAVTTPSAQPSHPAPMHTAVTAPASSANPIAQGNGGDHDSDNNGGPSDGDGTL